MMASTVYKAYQQLFYLCLHKSVCVDVGKIIIPFKLIAVPKYRYNYYIRLLFIV